MACEAPKLAPGEPRRCGGHNPLHCSTSQRRATMTKYVKYIKVARSGDIDANTPSIQTHIPSSAPNVCRRTSAELIRSPHQHSVPLARLAICAQDRSLGDDVRCRCRSAVTGPRDAACGIPARHQRVRWMLPGNRRDDASCVLFVHRTGKTESRSRTR